MSSIFETLIGKASAAGAASTGVSAINVAANEPSETELAEASIEVAESRRLTQGYVDPTEPTRPSIDDEAAPVFFVGSKSLELGAPVPVASTTYATTAPAATCGRPVQILPASGDRPRRVVIRCGAEPVELFTDSREGVDASTPAAGGYALPAAATHETTTQGPIYAAAADAWSVSVWIDHYPAPVT